MALDLRDLLRSEMRVHPRLAQQGLFEGAEARMQIAATIPPLVPFGDADYAGALWVIDWDYRLPSRHAALRLYAYYTPERRRELEDAVAAREKEIAAEDLFPEFDVSDFAGLPADEAYEARPIWRQSGAAAAGQRMATADPARCGLERRRDRAGLGSLPRAARERPRPTAGPWRFSSRPSGRRPARAATSAGPWTSGTSSPSTG